MARGLSGGESLRFRLADLLIWILTLLESAWALLTSLQTRGVGWFHRSPQEQQRGSARVRGSRPARPTTIGLIFAEASPQDVSLQQAANVVAW